MKYIYLFTLIVFYNISYSQGTVAVKSLVGNDSLYIELPSNFKDTLFNHEEGFFLTYFWTNGCIVDIQYGGLSKYPFINNDKSKITMETETNERVIKMGFLISNSKYWRVDYLKNKRLTIAYYNVHIENKDLFNRCFNSIRVFR